MCSVVLNCQPWPGSRSTQPSSAIWPSVRCSRPRGHAEMAHQLVLADLVGQGLAQPLVDDRIVQAVLVILARRRAAAPRRSSRRRRSRDSGTERTAPVCSSARSAAVTGARDTLNRSASSCATRCVPSGSSRARICSTMRRATRSASLSLIQSSSQLSMDFCIRKMQMIATRTARRTGIAVADDRIERPIAPAPLAATAIARRTLLVSGLGSAMLAATAIGTSRLAAEGGLFSAKGEQ